MHAFVLKHRMSSFIVGYVTIFLLLAFFGYFIAGQTSNHNTPMSGTASSHGFMTELAYYDLPRMVISTSGGDGGGGAQAHHVRMDLALEVASKDVNVLDGYQPRITDRLNRFLENLRPDQLDHSSMPWLREQILKQINSAGAPVPVHDIVFRELVVM